VGRKEKHAPVSLIVIHSHSHNDHTAGDEQFKALPSVQYIAPKPEEIQKAAGIANWPADLGQIDLGGSIVDVIPFPGHDVSSIALYDRRTGNLMTAIACTRVFSPSINRTLATFAASTQRLTDFVGDRPWRMCWHTYRTKSHALRRLWPRHPLSTGRTRSGAFRDISSN